MINGLVDFALLFFRALCPFIPAFREMAGVPLALTDGATELIFALPCSVPLDSRALPRRMPAELNVDKLQLAR